MRELRPFAYTRALEALQHLFDAVGRDCGKLRLWGGGFSDTETMGKGERAREWDVLWYCCCHSATSLLSTPPISFDLLPLTLSNARCDGDDLTNSVLKIKINVKYLQPWASGKALCELSLAATMVRSTTHSTRGKGQHGTWWRCDCRLHFTVWGYYYTRSRTPARGRA
jgi:hypothetical protein